MSRIKIQDLPQDQTISKEELKRIKGGITLSSSSLLTSTYKFDELGDSYLKIYSDSLYNTAGKI
jgi:hypothetical protein